MATLRRIFCVFALSLTFALAFSMEPLSEAQVKVAYVYNFAKFTKWPAAAFATPQSPLNLCLLRAKEAYGAFSGLEGKLVQGRVLQVRRMTRLDELKSCHLLYLSESDERHMSESLRSIGDAPVLTVSDIEGFTDAGGMVSFVAIDDNIRFEVNLEAAQRANVNFGADLLKLARVVRDGQSKGKQ
jgi:hypothetical protein